MTDGVALAAGTGAVAVGVADATRTGGGEALGVAEGVALGEGIAVAVGTGAVATTVGLGDGAAWVGEGLAVAMGFVGEEAAGRVADFVGEAEASGDSIVGSTRPAKDDQRPKPTINSANTPPPMSTHLRACASCGATIIPGGPSGASSGGVVSGDAAGRGCRGDPAEGTFADGVSVSDAADESFFGGGGGFQPGGASICTMPLHFGQARICPMALSCRTFNFERHVMQVTEKSSTGANRSSTLELLTAQRRYFFAGACSYSASIFSLRAAAPLRVTT